MDGSHEMKSAAPDVKLTYDDYVLLSDDGRRHELVDGEHYVAPSPVPRHQAILWNLVELLAPYLRAHPVGRAFVAPLAVRLSEFDVVEPDLLFISSGRLGEVVAATHVAGAPDLVVEIGSPGSRKRDETIKRRLYDRHGVPEYWLVDPELEIVKVFRRSGDIYARAEELRREDGDVLTSRQLPGLELPLTRLFEA